VTAPNIPTLKPAFLRDRRGGRVFRLHKRARARCLGKPALPAAQSEYVPTLRRKGLVNKADHFLNVCRRGAFSSKLPARNRAMAAVLFYTTIYFVFAVPLAIGLGHLLSLSSDPRAAEQTKTGSTANSRFPLTPAKSKPLLPAKGPAAAAGADRARDAGRRALVATSGVRISSGVPLAEANQGMSHT
jgi:hypothetical protein